jgi:hypothetical protein
MGEPRPRPELVYQREPCRQCGAITVSSAETLCTATQGQDGDYHCSGGDENVDPDGYFQYPTKESIAAQDDWYADQADALGVDGLTGCADDQLPGTADDWRKPLEPKADEAFVIPDWLLQTR